MPEANEDKEVEPELSVFSDEEPANDELDTDDTLFREEPEAAAAIGAETLLL